MSRINELRSESRSKRVIHAFERNDEVRSLGNIIMIAFIAIGILALLTVLVCINDKESMRRGGEALSVSPMIIVDYIIPYALVVFFFRFACFQIANALDYLTMSAYPDWEELIGMESDTKDQND